MLKRILQLIVVLLIAAQGVMAQTVQIESVTKPPGDIRVQVDMLSFTDVAAITLKIEFNSNLMEFIGIDSTQLIGDWLANDNGDVIIVTYTAAAGSGYNINGKAFDLLFDYHGGFADSLMFDESGCEISNSSLGIISSSYVNGSVTQSAALGTVTMTDLVDTVENTVNMPINMEGAGFSSVGSITFKIAYDEFQLSYAGLVDDAITGATASANNGVLEIEWTAGTPMDFSSLTHLLDVQFVYHGGNADVAFVPGCEINDGNLVPIATDYTDGTVTAVAGTRTLTIATVDAPDDSIPVMVDVPVVATDFTDDTVGAVTMHLSFDNSRLEYAGFINGTLSGWTVNYNNGDAEVTLEWSDAAGSLCLDTIVTLKFNYDTIGGDGEINFAPGTVIKDKYAATIPVNFVNGAISDGGSVVTYTVSGQLTYMGDVTRPIGTDGSISTTVYLRNTSDSTIAYFGGADADGNYSISGVLDGNYFIDASTTIDVTPAYDISDAFIIYGIGNTLTGLQALASDVNADNTVDMSDAFIVYGSVNAGNVKVASWIAPDWFFENTAVSVSGGDVTVDFSGIASGDANGDWVPMP